MRLIIELSERDKEKLLTPVAGSGGFQSLLRNLQHGIHGNELVLTVDQNNRNN
ncbi:MAG: hypothetical protein PWR06_2052 [Thermoanaerobacteraceae bacterium]|nr:hypothetical protein [Thermoanaerobacteraceae bacterium]